MQVLWQMTILSNAVSGSMQMKSKRKPKRKKPASDREALWGTDPLTDKHNDWVLEQLAKQVKEKDDERLAE